MKFLTMCALFGIISAKQLYDPNMSDVTNYTQMNFDKQVTQKRDKGIAVVHFYKSSGKSFYLIFNMHDKARQSMTQWDTKS